MSRFSSALFRLSLSQFLDTPHDHLMAQYIVVNSVRSIYLCLKISPMPTFTGGEGLKRDNVETQIVLSFSLDLIVNFKNTQKYKNIFLALCKEAPVRGKMDKEELI